MSGSPWLVSARFDVGVLFLPPMVMVGIALTVPEATALSPMGWVLAVVGIDVAHVYASLYRTYLHRDTWNRRKALLIALPIAVCAVLTGVHAASWTWFWTAMAYLAVFHFIRQQIGFSMLYRLRQGVPTWTRGARLERATLYALTGFPVLWWHANLPRSFEWFVPGDFLGGVPAWLVWPAAATTAALVIAHVATRLRSWVWSPGRDLWMLMTGAVWMGGIVWSNADVAFTLTNVVAHGIPYLALVAVVCHREWTNEGEGALSRAWFAPRNVIAFLSPLLVLAFVEEGLWDGLVWHDHEWLFGTYDPAPWLSWIGVPLLATPQVTHYILDGFIWRVRDDPALARAIAGHARA